MFDPNSRYADVETVMFERTGADGEPEAIAYKRRRLIPAAEANTTLAEHVVKQGDRIDNIAARYLGDPLEFWRICDANHVIRPDDLVTVGDGARPIRIVLPEL